MLKDMFSGGSMWAGVIAGGLNQIQHTNALRNGQMDGQEYAMHTTRNVGSTMGIMAGIEYGAMLGSAVMPGVGTVVGSIVGGMVGNRLGHYVGHHTGNMVFAAGAYATGNPGMNPMNQRADEKANHAAAGYSATE